MQFGHAHRHGRHYRHVGIAAHRLAAVAIIGLELGLVADADLPQLNPRLQLAGQVFDQFPEIDPLFGQEVEDCPLAAEEPFDVHQLHLQSALGDQSGAGLEIGTLQFAESFNALAVLIRHNAKDLPVSRFDQLRDGLRDGRAQNLTDLVPTVGVDDYVAAAGEQRRPGGGELPQMRASLHAG